ncbi:hypothetical protein FRC15_010035, partial [Serendipita sp. 397]
PSCFQTIDALETHFAQRHAFVCPEPDCTCILHSEHFLQLHRKEFHDSRALEAKENGESIYECLVPNCDKLSPTPNQRKRHLINDHGFDEKFFFSVIKYGISAQIRAWATQMLETTPVMTATTTKSTPTKSNDTKPSDDSSIDRSSRSRARIKPGKSALSSRASGSHSRGGGRDSSVDGMTQTLHTFTFINTRAQISPGTPSYGELSSSSQTHPASTASDRSMTAFRSGIDGTTEDDNYGDNDEDEGDDEDELPDSSPERGVRFAEEVDVRLLSPVSRRYNGRRGGGISGRRVRNNNQPNGSTAGLNPNTSTNTNGGRRGGGRTGGVHSDDEASGRRRNVGEGRQASGPRGRGRGRGRPPHTDRSQYTHGS